MSVSPILCYVTDRRGPFAAGRSLGDTIRSAVSAGLDWIQIREKDLMARALLDLARDAVAAARGSATKIIVNDRLDVALAASASGVHLGRDSLPAAESAHWLEKPHETLRVVRPFLLGVSCHSLEEARQASRDGANYIFFGPVFATPSKETFGPPQGLDKMEEVTSQVRVPVLAIGGITADNAASCLGAGAAGLAAIRLFQQAADLGELVNRLRAL